MVTNGPGRSVEVTSLDDVNFLWTGRFTGIDPGVRWTGRRYLPRHAFCYPGYEPNRLGGSRIYAEPLPGSPDINCADFPGLLQENCARTPDTHGDRFCRLQRAVPACDVRLDKSRSV